MKKRIVSTMLALLMAFGAFGMFFTIPTSVAAEEITPEPPATEDTFVEEYVAIVDAALTTSYESAQDKLDSDENMNIAVRYGNYELYVNKYTGEVGYKDITTGQVLLSNPYNVPNYTSIAEATRKQLLSQLVVGYTDNGQSKIFYSYTEAAARGQIIVKNIKNGIRLEYTIGRLDANYLCPGMITAERMVEMISSVMVPGLSDYTPTGINDALRGQEEGAAFAVKKVLAAYTFEEWAPSRYKEGSVEMQNHQDELCQKYPVLNKLQKSLYVLADSVTARDKRRIEDYIKTYCPDYTHEEMEKDHEETEYVSKEVEPPLFRMALEYTLSEEGLVVRLPANGIRFNYSLYSLNYITPLQFFGAGDLNNDGYLFYPDGSGAIFYYDDLAKKSGGTLTGKVYGPDYAYHEISGKHQESIRMPVFGLVNTITTQLKDAEGNSILVPDANGNEIPKTVTETTGFLSILEEGDATANITAEWGGSSHNYASVYTTYYPRPKDTYDLAGTISVGANSTWTVESTRKYTGSYKMRIVMLSDASQKEALEAADREYYEASYVGMAMAYRDYLVDIVGKLKPLSASDVKNGSIPLYIESFGTVPDTERFLSIPVEVDVPLTTFEDIYTMYKELSDNGIGNVNFKLTGFANGGMYATYPNRLNWMKEVGGADGFKKVLAQAKDNGFGLYPDFDFMYVSNKELFDGVDLHNTAARTIDGRYSSKRIYDATYQEFVSYFDICVTPSIIEEYYERFTGAYKEYGPLGISVSTMGSDLNSDFGDRAPANREDAKEVITKLFAEVEKDYGSVMTSGGNVYALAYTDHLLGAALDSSRFATASRSVPFVGMVLHGHVNFAGSAINMAGNINYQVLKAIENGASLYFTLSYRNTNLLKEYKDLSQYYAVNYQIWAWVENEDGENTPGELFDVYNKVNSAIGNLQTSMIVNHQFLIGERIATEAEKQADAQAVAEAWANARETANAAYRQALIAEYRQQLENGVTPDKTVAEIMQMEAPQENVDKVFASYNLSATTTDSEATAGDDYNRTKYTMDDGMIVMVTYEGGTAFILNYNVYEVSVIVNGETHVLPAYGYEQIQL